MKENISQNLIDEWEKRLANAGLPAPDEKPSLEVTFDSLKNASEGKVDHSLISEDDLRAFKKLPRKFRSDIIKDIGNQKKRGSVYRI